LRTLHLFIVHDRKGEEQVKIIEVTAFSLLGSGVVRKDTPELNTLHFPLKSMIFLFHPLNIKRNLDSNGVQIKYKGCLSWV
jgi:hypothetical protein